MSQVTVLASAGIAEIAPVGDGIDPPTPLAGYIDYIVDVCASALHV